MPNSIQLPMKLKASTPRQLQDPALAVVLPKSKLPSKVSLPQPEATTWLEKATEGCTRLLYIKAVSVRRHSAVTVQETQSPLEWICHQRI